MGTKKAFFVTLAALTMLLGLTTPVAAQQKPPPDDPNYMAQGRMLILRVVPGDKSLKLFFLGKKAGELDMKKDHLVLSITATGNKKQEVLKFKESGEAYEVSELPKWNEPYDLSVKSQVKGTVEELKVKIPAKKP